MGQVLFVIVFSFTCVFWAITGQTLVAGPHNTAVIYGKAVTLPCQADLNGDELEWRRVLNGTDIVIWNSKVNNITDDRFDMDINSQTGKYNLLIPSAEGDLAGLYYVQLVSRQAKQQAELVVLGGLGCIPSTTHTIEEGSDIIVQCVTSYYGYKAPTMKAYHGNTLLTTEDIVSEDYKITVSSFPGRIHHNDTQYRCEMFFTADVNDTSPPDMEAHCTTAVFIVLYGIRNMSITPTDISAVSVGDQFNCTAASYPSPQYKWYCQDRTYLQAGALLTIGEELLGEQTCICNAYTTIFGQQRQDERNITFTASADGSNPGEEPGPPIAVIATLVSLVAAGCVAVCVFLLVKTKRIHDENKKKISKLVGNRHDSDT